MNNRERIQSEHIKRIRIKQTNCVFALHTYNAIHRHTLSHRAIVRLIHEIYCFLLSLNALLVQAIPRTFLFLNFANDKNRKKKIAEKKKVSASATAHD